MSDELTEEEKKKLKLPKDILLVEDNGEMLISLDQPAFVKIKNPMKFFPFGNMMGKKQAQYMSKVHEEVKKRNGRPRPLMPTNGVFPFDIFVIEFKLPPKDDNDCESE